METRPENMANHLMRKSAITTSIKNGGSIRRAAMTSPMNTVLRAITVAAMTMTRIQAKPMAMRTTKDERAATMETTITAATVTVK
jgi:hypothetical protein